MKVDINTKMVTLIGTPLGQSFAARMQNAGYEAAGLNMLYFYTQADSEHLGEIVAGIRHMNFAGFAVTKPNKVQVLRYLDELDPLCRKMGACNTVVKTPEGRLIGRQRPRLGDDPQGGDGGDEPDRCAQSIDGITVLEQEHDVDEHGAQQPDEDHGPGCDEQPGGGGTRTAADGGGGGRLGDGDESSCDRGQGEGHDEREGHRHDEIQDVEDREEHGSVGQALGIRAERVDGEDRLQQRDCAENHGHDDEHAAGNRAKVPADCDRSCAGDGDECQMQEARTR